MRLRMTPTAGHKILEHLNATAGFGVTSETNGELTSLEFAYVLTRM